MRVPQIIILKVLLPRLYLFALALSTLWDDARVRRAHAKPKPKPRIVSGQTAVMKHISLFGILFVRCLSDNRKRCVLFAAAFECFITIMNVNCIVTYNHLGQKITSNCISKKLHRLNYNSNDFVLTSCASIFFSLIS